MVVKFESNLNDESRECQLHSFSNIDIRQKLQGAFEDGGIEQLIEAIAWEIADIKYSN